MGLWNFGCPNISTSEEIRRKLKELNIGTRPFFYPMHQQPVFKEMGIFDNKSYPNSEEIYKSGFYLPSGLNLNFKIIEKVSPKLKYLIQK